MTSPPFFARRTSLGRVIRAIRLTCCGLSLLLTWTPGSGAQETPGSGAETPAGVETSVGLSGTEALREGNRLFAAGELESALRVYEAGYRPDSPHPALVYNLATTLHHLDRLPEAILWYRRGDAEDPWLQENLWLARRSLGSQRLGVSGAAAFMAERSGLCFAAAAAVAWLSLLLAAWPRAPRGVWAGTLGVAMLLWIGAWMMARHAPREAVLLEECATAAGELPAGTELWFWPSDEESLAVAGVADARCLEETVGWIEPGASGA